MQAEISHFFAAKTLQPAHSLVNTAMRLLAFPGREDLSDLVAIKPPISSVPQGSPAPSLTRVSPQVACEGIPASAGIVTQVTFEGLFARVQLYVAQKVAFLGKRGPALIALERAFS